MPRVTLDTRDLEDLGLTIAPHADGPAHGYVATLAGRGELRGLGGQWGAFDTPEAAVIGALRAILHNWAHAEGKA